MWDTYLDWLSSFEYKLLRIPEPSLVVYLRVDPNVSQKLMMGRYKGYEEKKDVHEKDVVYLKRCRVVTDYCARKLGWRAIECTDSGEMRSIEDIQEGIFQKLKGSLVA